MKLGKAIVFGQGTRVVVGLSVASTLFLSAATNILTGIIGQPLTSKGLVIRCAGASLFALSGIAAFVVLSMRENIRDRGNHKHPDNEEARDIFWDTEARSCWLFLDGCVTMALITFVAGLWFTVLSSRADSFERSTQTADIEALSKLEKSVDDIEIRLRSMAETLKTASKSEDDVAAKLAALNSAISLMGKEIMGLRNILGYDTGVNGLWIPNEHLQPIIRQNSPSESEGTRVKSVETNRWLDNP